MSPSMYSGTADSIVLCIIRPDGRKNRIMSCGVTEGFTAHPIISWGEARWPTMLSARTGACTGQTVIRTGMRNRCRPISSWQMNKAPEEEIFYAALLYIASNQCYESLQFKHRRHCNQPFPMTGDVRRIMQRFVSTAKKGI